MKKAAFRKLSKPERRSQLLRVAHAIVRKEGTDALTLGTLAERAGVSKPIAYEHFETRSGLLIALYEEIENHHVAALLQSLKQAKKRLPDVAQVVSNAYFQCYRDVGPEWQAIAAALQGDEDMNAFQQTVIERYVKILGEALAPYSKLGKEELRLRCLGFIGAAEAMVRDVTRRGVGDKQASGTLAALIVAALA